MWVRKLSREVSFGGVRNVWGPKELIRHCVEEEEGLLGVVPQALLGDFVWWGAECVGLSRAH